MSRGWSRAVTMVPQSASTRERRGCMHCCRLRSRITSIPTIEFRTRFVPKTRTRAARADPATILHLTASRRTSSSTPAAARAAGSSSIVAIRTSFTATVIKARLHNTIAAPNKRAESTSGRSMRWVGRPHRCVIAFSGPRRWQSRRCIPIASTWAPTESSKPMMAARLGGPSVQT